MNRSQYRWRILLKAMNYEAQEAKEEQVGWLTSILLVIASILISLAFFANY